MADIDQSNLPDTVSSGAVVANSTLARESNVINPAGNSAVTNNQTANTQFTNATSSVPPIPERFPAIPSLPNASSPFQNAAQNTLGGLSGTGGSPISAASVTQTRVERNTQSFVYRVTQVTSRFSQGKFTQNLEGVILNFDDYVGNAGVNTNQAPDLNSGDAERQEGGFFGNASTTNRSVSYQSTPRIVAGTNDRDFDAIDDNGGTGPAGSAATTNSDGQTIELIANVSLTNSGTVSSASQVIARDP